MARQSPLRAAILAALTEANREVYAREIQPRVCKLAQRHIHVNRIAAFLIFLKNEGLVVSHWDSVRVMRYRLRGAYRVSFSPGLTSAAPDLDKVEATLGYLDPRSPVPRPGFSGFVSSVKIREVFA